MTLSRHLDALVGYQLARWEAVWRPPAIRPCVAIASLPGAGGEEVGRHVAEQLGYGLFGREIVDEIEAEQALVNANMELIERFERKIQATLARVWGEDTGAVESVAEAADD